MKTRWESFVFILLMLLPAICLLSTATRPDAPVAGNTVSQPCASETPSESLSGTKTGGSKRDNEGVGRHTVNAADVSSSPQ